MICMSKITFSNLVLWRSAFSLAAFKLSPVVWSVSLVLSFLKLFKVCGVLNKVVQCGVFYLCYEGLIFDANYVYCRKFLTLLLPSRS